MKQQKITIPGDWLYFTSKDISVRDIYDCMKNSYEMEIWEDAGVLEIELTEGSSMDIEAASIHPKDEATAAFAKSKGCSFVFLVTFRPEDYEKAAEAMRRIQKQLSGFFCGDTENFTPILTD